MIYPAPSLPSAAGQRSAAPPPLLPFSFQQRFNSLQWHSILQCNLENITSTIDIDSLQTYTHSLVYSDILPTELPPGNHNPLPLIQAYRILQLITEYLLYVQQYLLRENTVRDNLVDQLSTKLLSLRGVAQEKLRVVGEKNVSLRNEIKVMKQAMKAYERQEKVEVLLSSHEQSSAEQASHQRQMTRELQQSVQQQLQQQAMEHQQHVEQLEAMLQSKAESSRSAESTQLAAYLSQLQHQHQQTVDTITLSNTQLQQQLQQQQTVIQSLQSQLEENQQTFLGELQRLRDSHQQQQQAIANSNQQENRVKDIAEEEDNKQQKESAASIAAQQELQAMRVQMQQLQSQLEEQRRSSEERDRQHQAMQAEQQIAKADQADERVQKLEEERLRQSAQHDAELIRIRAAAAAATAEAEATLQRERELHMHSMLQLKQQEPTVAPALSKTPTQDNVDVHQPTPAPTPTTPTHIRQLRQTLQLRAAKPYTPYADQFPFLHSRYEHDLNSLQLYNNQTESLVNDWQGNTAELQEMETYIEIQQLQEEKLQVGQELDDYVKLHHKPSDHEVKAQPNRSTPQTTSTNDPALIVQSSQPASATHSQQQHQPSPAVADLPLISPSPPPPRPQSGKPSVDLGTPTSPHGRGHLRSASKPLPSIPVASSLAQTTTSSDNIAVSSDGANIDERQKKMLSRSLSKPLPTPVFMSASTAMTPLESTSSMYAPVTIDAATSPITATGTDTQTSTDAPTQHSQSTQATQQLAVGQSVHALLAEGFTPKPDPSADASNHLPAAVTPAKAAAASTSSPLPAFTSNPLLPLPAQSDDDEFGIDEYDLIPSHTAVPSMPQSVPHNSAAAVRQTAPSPAVLHQPAVLVPALTSVPVQSAVPAPASTSAAVVVCELCEMYPAVLRCETCDQNLCTEGGCDADLHQPLRMQTHQREPLQLEATADRQMAEPAADVKPTSAPLPAARPATASSLPEPSTVTDAPPSTSNVSAMRNTLLALGFTPTSAEQQIATQQSKATVQLPQTAPLLPLPTLSSESTKTAVPTVLPQLPEKKPIITAGRRAATAGQSKPVFKMDYSLAG